MRVNCLSRPGSATLYSVNGRWGWKEFAYQHCWCIKASQCSQGTNRYLAQLCKIDEGYASSVYNLLPDHNFPWADALSEAADAEKKVKIQTSVRPEQRTGP